MRKLKASLYLRFRMPGEKQSPYCPALYDSKSRIRPFWCLVNGVPEHHPEATYYKRVRREGKWEWESVGKEANAAFAKSRVSPLVATKPTLKEADAMIHDRDPLFTAEFQDMPRRREFNR